MAKNPMNLDLTTWPGFDKDVFALTPEGRTTQVASVTAPDGYDQATLLRAMAMVSEMYSVIEQITMSAVDAPITAEMMQKAEYIVGEIMGDAE